MFQGAKNFEAFSLCIKIRESGTNEGVGHMSDKGSFCRFFNNLMAAVSGFSLIELELLDISPDGSIKLFFLRDFLNIQW